MDLNTPQPSPRSTENFFKSKAFISGFIFLLLMVAILLGLYLYTKSVEKRNEAANLQARSEITSGVQALWDANNSEAVNILAQAVETAATPDIKAAAEFNYASALYLDGKKVEAVAKMKEIVGHTEYPPYFRARAIEFMARMFFLTHDPEVFQLVFNGKPYDDLEVEGAKDVSIRNLLEYGESIYPLALAELKIARLYAEDMIEKKSEDPKTIELIKKYIDKAELEFATADSIQLRNLVARKAIAVGWIYELGDRSYGDPEKYFKELLGLEHNKQHAIKADSGERIRYAMFLARNYGSSRSADIKQLLADAVSSPNFQSSNIYEVINNERLSLTKFAPSNSVAYDIALAEKNPALSFDAKSLILLAKIDPAFKKTLINLGWNIK